MAPLQEYQPSSPLLEDSTVQQYIMWSEKYNIAEPVQRRTRLHTAS